MPLFQTQSYLSAEGDIQQMLAREFETRNRSPQGSAYESSWRTQRPEERNFTHTNGNDDIGFSDPRPVLYSPTDPQIYGGRIDENRPHFVIPTKPSSPHHLSPQQQPTPSSTTAATANGQQSNQLFPHLTSFISALQPLLQNYQPNGTPFPAPSPIQEESKGSNLEKGSNQDNGEMKFKKIEIDHKEKQNKKNVRYQEYSGGESDLSDNEERRFQERKLEHKKKEREGEKTKNIEKRSERERELEEILEAERKERKERERERERLNKIIEEKEKERRERDLERKIEKEMKERREGERERDEILKRQPEISTASNKYEDKKRVVDKGDQDNDWRFMTAERPYAKHTDDFSDIRRSVRKMVHRSPPVFSISKKISLHLDFAILSNIKTTVLK